MRLIILWGVAAALPWQAVAGTALALCRVHHPASGAGTAVGAVDAGHATAGHAAYDAGHAGHAGQAVYGVHADHADHAGAAAARTPEAASTAGPALDGPWAAGLQAAGTGSADTSTALVGGAAGAGDADGVADPAVACAFCAACGVSAALPPGVIAAPAAPAPVRTWAVAASDRITSLHTGGPERPPRHPIA